jgi:hypothetical protein
VEDGVHESRDHVESRIISIPDTNRFWKYGKRFFIAVAATALISLLYIRICLGLDFNPIPDAAGSIRDELKSNGYNLQGFLGDYVQESDDWGGMEVRIQFRDVDSESHARDVTVHARRSWILAPWHITKLSVDKEK